MKHSVLVIGLGRFGSAAAHELAALGHEVLAIDTDEARVNEIAPHVTRALQLDATDADALRAVGAADFQHAIVAISGGAEASIFATMALKELGVGNVITKAGSRLHGAILERAGADRVVFPEREMGQRVAHSFSVRDVMDYLDVTPRARDREGAAAGLVRGAIVPGPRARGAAGADARGAPTRDGGHGQPRRPRPRSRPATS